MDVYLQPECKHLTFSLTVLGIRILMSKEMKHSISCYFLGDGWVHTDAEVVVFCFLEESVVTCKIRPSAM